MIHEGYASKRKEHGEEMKGRGGAKKDVGQGKAAGSRQRGVSVGAD